MLKQLMVASLAAFVSLACTSQQPINSESTSVDSQYDNNYLTRDVRDDVFYFVMPDRFYNGDTSNDLGNPAKPESYGGFDPSKKSHFHGGDMKGLEAKLDYLEGMGVTAIWMTPILRNQAVQGEITGYHGYWVLDFTEIDPHLGSNQDLKDLISAAHTRGIKVYFDIITNHTADVIKFKECHGADGSKWSLDSGNCPYRSRAEVRTNPYTVVIPKHAKAIKVPAWLNDPKYYHNQGDSTWSGENSLYGDFAGLDDIDTDNPKVVKEMIDIFSNIITEFKPDGFRVDTVKHVNTEFWAAFTPAIMAHAKAQGIPNFHVFGEVYSGDVEVLSHYTTEGNMPAVLDFGFQGTTSEVLVKNKGTNKLSQLFDNDDYYNDGDSRADMNLNFVGNHDMGRFSYFLTQSTSALSEQTALAKIKLAHALMYFSRGIPVIYYGDEQGFVGTGGDMASRQDMMPSKVPSYNNQSLLGTQKTTADDNFDREHPLYQAFANLSNTFKQHKALRRGVHINRLDTEEEAGVYAFSRVDLTDKVEYLVLFNTSEQIIQPELAATANTYVDIANNEEFNTNVRNQISAHVPPLSYRILKATSVIKPLRVNQFKLTSHNNNDELSGEVIFQYQMTAQIPTQVPIFEMTSYLSVNGQLFEKIAFDNTLPLTTHIDVSQYPAGTVLKLKTQLSNLAGDVTTQIHDFTVVK
ncbi:alpha-amylase [Catenovulum sp. SM1970]|uniref:alpha-amylase family glycosyl hydrolase n=1 Tax=Marinifaba aquimaris TaxID=2741323 RepID=UPI00157356C4|nr:alpha-amylase family glycosyl hydrolase [Marinifaba aquimaris]NTS75919.1 alpha-amylase [Marinifaba aquimaris]